MATEYQGLSAKVGELTPITITMASYQLLSLSGDAHPRSSKFYWMTKNRAQSDVPQQWPLKPVLKLFFHGTLASAISRAAILTFEFYYFRQGPKC